jgi:autotransporter-associated beta strand protein
MTKNAIRLAVVGVLASATTSLAQTSYTSTTATGAWNTTRWNNSADGPTYTSSYTANNNVHFTLGTYSFAGMGATINVGNITVNDGVTVTFTSTSNTFATNSAVRTITVGTNATIDFSTQSFSTASGTGLIKNGLGVLALAGGAYNGGFTLNAGTVIARGVDAFGAAATNVLTLNGGVVASNANRIFADTKHGGGIVIGGNVQFGELATVVSLASSTANLTFANNVSLGSATRTLTQGNNGTNTFSGVISNSGSGGITFAANPGTDGRFDITNTTNTFTGNININGGEVRFTGDGSMGNAANDIIIDGGRFGIASGGSVILGSGRDVSVGDGAGTSITVPGASGSLTYNRPILDKTGETGSWAKQGQGNLILGGASTYTGNTAINNGTVTLSTGSNRLPTTTVLSFGQVGSANVGGLDLGGFNQEVAGLVSVTGTNTSTNKNAIGSTGSPTLTLSGSGSYSYGDGTTQNSGVINHAISIVKAGSGTQIFGDNNTYTGTTTINAGTLLVNGSHTGTGGGYTVNSGGTLGGTGTISRSVTVNSGGKLAPGNQSPLPRLGTLTINTSTSSLTLLPGSNFEVDVDNTGGTVTAADQLVVGSGSTSVDISNANLQFVFVAPGTGPVTTPTPRVLVKNDSSNPITGSFAGLPRGGLMDSFEQLAGSVKFTIYYSYDEATSSFVGGNDIAISFTHVPEPAALSLLALSALGLRRRRS